MAANGGSGAVEPDWTRQGRADDAVIVWNESSRAVTDVRVAFLPLRVGAPSMDLWQLWRGTFAAWDYAFGAVSPGWMGSAGARPEALFSYFLIAGFATRGAERRAYAEFARIEECGWARPAGETGTRRRAGQGSGRILIERPPPRRTGRRALPPWARLH